MERPSFTSRLVRIGSTMTIAAVVSIGIAVPHAHAADANLSAQIDMLLKQVAALQAQLHTGASGTPSTSSVSTMGAVSTHACLPPPAVARVLTVGSRGSDVSALQAYLAQDTAIYPEASVTGYFGPATAAAVGRFQVARGILPNGSSAANGLGTLGPKTRGILQASGCAVTASGTVSASTSPGSGAGSGSVNASSNANVDASTKSIDAMLNQIQNDLKGN